MPQVNFNLQQLIRELRRDEGVRYTRYQDTLGYWTIGVGHLLKGANDPLWSKTLTDAEVDELLREDILKAFTDIASEQFYRACDTDARKRALINMSFQLGHNGLREFVNSLREIAQKKWKQAGARLRLSKWYRETPVRAERVIGMIENG